MHNVSIKCRHINIPRAYPRHLTGWCAHGGGDLSDITGWLFYPKGGKFSKKLWCCVGGEHYKIIWFINWVGHRKDWDSKADVSSVSPLSERIKNVGANQKNVLSWPRYRVLKSWRHVFMNTHIWWWFCDNFFVTPSARVTRRGSQKNCHRTHHHICVYGGKRVFVLWHRIFLYWRNVPSL